MINKLKILRLTFRLFFYGYFIVWSLYSFYKLPDYKNTSTSDNELYLISNQSNISLFTFTEENKRTKYSEETSAKNYFSGKFLVSFPIQILKLTGSFHFIQPYEIPVIVNVYSLIDHPRPPPFVS
ncbi:MAG TPA: hypothetical protein VLB50_03780 [Ignavibacteriaceae bacterium]|nr:hypothetical protein [Ignavibacteriaceae bacterium]